MARKKILLVDDAEVILELERIFFIGAGVDILTAGNGEEAFKIIQRERPDLILMDLDMPVMDGAECCRKVKTDPDLKSIPIIMVIQTGKEEDMQRCREAGCEEIILKPITMHVLFNTSAKYLYLIRRRALRVKVGLKVEFGMSPDNMLTNFTFDLSSLGMFIKTEEIQPAGTPLNLVFELPDLDREVRCSGRVAWINHPDNIIKPSFPPGMGVQFLDLSIDDLRTIFAFVKNRFLSQPT